MGLRYIQGKGLPHRGQQSKTDTDKYLTQEQVSTVLSCIENSKGEPAWNPRWRRDHAAIYLAYMLGLRIGETCLLERLHFDDIDRTDTARVPTLKQRVTISHACPQCKRRVRVRADRAGQDFQCMKCGSHSGLPESNGSPPVQSRDKELPFIEEQVLVYIREYLSLHMRPEQRWLFEGRGGEHISSAHLQRIFATYTMSAGLSPLYSWHSLRHGRGVRVYSQFRDLVFTRDALRHKDIKTAQIYARLDPERRAEYKKALERGALSLAGRTG